MGTFTIKESVMRLLTHWNEISSVTIELPYKSLINTWSVQVQDPDLAKIISTFGNPQNGTGIYYPKEFFISILPKKMRKHSRLYQNKNMNKFWKNFMIHWPSVILMLQEPYIISLEDIISLVLKYIESVWTVKRFETLAIYLWIIARRSQKRKVDFYSWWCFKRVGRTFRSIASNIRRICLHSHQWSFFFMLIHFRK